MKFNRQINVTGSKITSYLAGGVQYKFRGTDPKMLSNQRERRVMECNGELLSVVYRV